MLEEFHQLRSFKGIIDSTLREGLQYRFARFSYTQQIKILQILIRVGVDRIEVGNPYTQNVRKVLIRLTQVKKRPALLAHVRNRIEDIKAAIGSGANGVNIFCTIDKERLSKMHVTFEHYLTDLRESILYAKQYNLEIRVSVENFFRSDFRQIMRIYQFADRLGINRIGIADTLGVAMSWEVEEAVKIVKHLVQAEIEVHFHNDLGQAHSNAIIALRNGAAWVDTTLLGIGERSGITALSTFLAGLFIVDPSVAKRYQVGCITQAENEIAHMMGREVPFNLLTNKENGFAHKAGVHLDALIHFGPQKYEPLSPSVIGNSRQLIYGTSISGKTNKSDIDLFYKKFGKD